MNTQQSKKVLIVDDSIYMRLLIKKHLQKAGYQVIAEAADAGTAIQLALEYHPDLITLDNILPDMYGTDTLKLFESYGVKSKVVMISAVGQHAVVSEGLSRGASYYIVKPFTPETLISTVNRAMCEKS